MKTSLFFKKGNFFFCQYFLLLFLLFLFNLRAISQAPTTTVLTSNLNRSCIGSNVNLTATISTNLATGTVEFFEGANSLGISPVVIGAATLNTSALPAGTVSLTAVYSGDINYLASTSPGLTHVVDAGIPPTPGSITGTTPVCPGVSGLSYSISPVAGASSYTWAVPAGWTINSGQGTISISATSGAGSGNITVSSSNSCGSTGNPQIVNINPAVGADNTGYATASAKSSDGIVTSTTSSAPERRGYLKFPLAVIPAGSTVSAATLKITNNGTVGSSGALNTVRALGSNDPVSATAATLFAAVSSGNIYNTSVWSSLGQLSLSLAGTAPTDLTNSIAAPGYFALGLLRGSGPVIYNFYGYSGATNAPVLSVTYANVSSFAVTVNPGTPATPGSISSTPAVVCENSAGNTFSIAAVTGASTYTWSVPVGWSITAGQGSTSVTVTTLANNGNVTVTAGNSCGTSSAQSLAVTLQVRPTVAANPGSQERCSGVAIGTITITNPNNVTGTTFSWTRNNTVSLPPGIPAGPSAANPINGSINNNTGIQQLTTFTITASANGCASTTSATSLLYINPNPTASAGVDQQICAATSTTIGGSPTASAGTPGYTYLWTAGVSNTAIANPTAPAGTYTVTVTDSKTCQASDAVTITNGSSAKTWIGNGTTSGGPDNNFNNPLNWAPAGVPGPCNDVIMNLDVVNIANIFGGNLTIPLTANATIKSLAVDVQALTAFSSTTSFKLEVGTRALTILNATTLFTHGTAFFAQPARSYFSVGSGGVLTYAGNLTTTVANNCTNYPFYATTNNLGKMYVNGNATLGGIGNDPGNKPAQVIFDGIGTQTVSHNSAAQAICLGATTTNIGETNSPTVNLVGAGTGGFVNIGNLNINNISTLDIGTAQSMNRNAAGGTVTMAAGSTMRVGRNTGGTPVSNFPSNFSAFSFSPTSTVEYYGTSAQTIYAPPVYGNLTLTNNSIKTAGAPLTIAGNVLINTADFRANTATGWTHNVGGNWTNNGAFSYAGGTTNLINFNGSNNATIGGSSATNFHSMTVNKGASIATILNVVSNASIAASPALLTLTNGLLRIQSTSTFTQGGAGTNIASNAGLHINGGIFNVTNSTTSNQGLFRISSGTGNLGTFAGNSLDNNSGGTFDMSGGTLNIAARLTFSTNVTPTSTISGGTANLALIGNNSVTATLDMTAASKLNVSGGLITFKQVNGTGEDIKILETPGNKNFTGGLIQIGTAATPLPANAVFRINSAAPLYDITVNSFRTPVARLTNQIFGSHNITIGSGATLDAATNNMDIKLSGNWVNDGIFLPGLGTVTFNAAAAAESISGLAANTNFYNLSNANVGGNPLTINSNISIAKQLSLANGAKLHLSTGNITLRSNATTTANVDKIQTAEAITYATGKFIVERFIGSGSTAGLHPKAWQLLAVPVRGSQTIKAAWQEGALTPNGNPNPGFGTQITSNLGGSMAGAQALGFDVYTAPGPTMKTYNLNSDAWDGVPNTATQAIANKGGYMVFVRGSRNITAFNQTADSTVLRTSGELFMPSATVAKNPDTTQVAATYFRTIGNPYASAIDFTLIGRDPGVDNKFYTWDPLLTANYNGLGGYQLMSSLNGFKPVPGGNTKYNASLAHPNIESGQAFFVHSDAGGGVVSFTENSKVNTNAMVFRPQPVAGGISERHFLRVSLYNMNDGEARLADGNLAVFDNDLADEVDGDDAIKLLNPAENFAIIRNGKVFALEARKPVVSEDTLYYRFTNLRRQAYQLKFEPENMPRGLTASLVDQFNGITTPLSLTGLSTVDFSITEETATADPSRFYLIFQAQGPVPVSITKIAANRQGDGSISVDWNVENEINMLQYEVERSMDGRSFTKINTKTTGLHNTGTAVYNYFDRYPFAGVNYYRIRGVSQSGTAQYSAIVKVTVLKTAPAISVYPNPVTAHTINLFFSNQAPGEYKLQLSSESGQVIHRGAVQVNGSNLISSIILDKQVSTGTYRLTITGPDARLSILNLVIE